MKFDGTKRYFAMTCVIHLLEGTSMPYCPECGGEMHYTPGTKRYACKSCGLSLTHQELIEMRDQRNPSVETEEEQHDKQRREYLKWWLSSKKK